MGNNDISTCEWCKTQISWEDGDDLRGTAYYCERCFKHFCEMCFAEKHGAKALKQMLDGDIVLCPDCYSVGGYQVDEHRKNGVHLPIL